MKIFGYTLLGILAIVLLIVLAFGMEVGSLKWAGFFRPQWEDVRRETYERSKSYNHGKRADLAKRYSEWVSAETEDRTAIESLVKIEFPDFDKTTIDSPELVKFLETSRGY